MGLMVKASSLLAVLLALIASSGAVQKSYFYNFGKDAGDTSLPPFDDISSPEINLRVPIIFFGQVYNSIFVNSNGFVSFLTEIPQFFNIQFPLEYPMIAPLYSDVDAREAGNIWYRETSDPASVARATRELQDHFSSAKDFTPTGVFIVTWDGVGPFSQRKDRINTYQLVITTDGQDSYAMFHYAEGGIQWLQGDGKNPSMPDARCQAGLISGDGRFSTLKGSGTDQVRNLDKWSNNGTPGVWMYRIGQLALDETVQPPDLLSSDSSSTRVKDEPGSCALDGSVCHSHSECTDYTPGFCCSCVDTHFGNGLNCLKKDEPLRVTGKVIGKINGVELVDADLHSYVLTAEGRTYTAISRVPSAIGYDIQSMTSLGVGVAWLFAKSVGEAPNGFSVSGANFNRTTDVNFPQTGHNVVVQQHFMGLDVFNNIQVKTTITGSIPTVPLGSKIEMDAFDEEYTRVKPGQLRARSSRVFRLKGQTIDTPFTVETTLDYEECSWKPRTPQEDETIRLKVAENIFIQYDAPEQIVRYALSAKVAPLDEPDPCVEGRRECGQNSQCVVDGDNYRCVCERGYEEVYDSTINKAICLDVNECNTGRDNCHPDAFCINTPGGFTCTCKEDFIGDGLDCQRLASCSGIPCDPNAVCDVRGPSPRCVCRPGYVGDGFVCNIDQGETLINQQRDCIDADICSLYADCLYDDKVRGFRCLCADGYSGDGLTCTREVAAEGCDTFADCSPDATCNETPEGKRCECLPGFAGDGYICTDRQLPPYQPETPYQPYQPLDPYAQGEDEQPYQPYQPEQPYQPYRPEEPYQPYRPEEPYQPYQPEQPYQPYQPEQPYQPQEPQQPLDAGEQPEPECLFGVCWCPDVYQYDKDRNICVAEVGSGLQSGGSYGPKPRCGAAKCECPEGFIYNRVFESCEPDEIDDYLEARPLPSCFLGRCSCPKGYGYNDRYHDCRPDHTPGFDYSIKGGGGERREPCNKRNNCNSNAQCIYDGYAERYKCQCNAGYDGDGYYCNELDQCSSVQDCDINAQCLYDSASRRYTCQCNEGYEGDGTSCFPRREATCNIINNCDVNAECIYDSYSLIYRCQCRSGFEGDGTFCTATEVGCNVVYNCGDNAECAYDINVAGYRCSCREGFEGDGYFCRSSRSCQPDPSVCHPQAACMPDALSPFGYSCRCHDGYTGDGYNCQESPDHEKNLLLINQGLSVLRMPSDPRGGGGFPIHVEPFMTAVGADVDCLQGKYYWTDVGSASIRSSKYDGSERKPVVSGADIGSPEDVAVDWISGNVYWTDSVNDVVSVASIETGKRKTIIENGLVNPRGIAVHPGRGLLFWSDWNRFGPKIEVSGLDGSNRRVLVEQDISLPNSLVVDYDTQTLCWADAGTHKIECIGVDGNGRRTVMEGALYPFGLTTLGQDFFYTDWNDTRIHVVNRYSGIESPSRPPPPGGSGRLYGIAAVPHACPPVSNVCGVSHGGCPASHLCLPNGRGGRTCACTTHPPSAEDEQCVDYNY
ncbi:nidogen-like isoform X3 [Penaeus japonicus]|uniref:nidogen-like isoform X3 n=1 Tax=Penaeus japonicus TaxID=27405 RepID=UPI001C71171D|nr:nidogen-like isoform X3 [Penaeus japonicus]